MSDRDRIAHLQRLLDDAEAVIANLQLDLNCERAANDGLRERFRPWGVINPASPRYDRWLELVGSDAARLVSAYPEVDATPSGWPRPVYRIDHDALGRPGAGRAIRTLARVWEVSEAEALRQADGDGGIPVAAEDVFLCLDPETGREFWRSAASGRHAGGPREPAPPTNGDALHDPDESPPGAAP